MKISKIIKFISLPLFVIFLLLFWQNVLSFFISMNVEASKSNLLALTFIYWLELLLVLSIYDFVIFRLSINISCLLDNLGQYFIRMKWVGIALYIVRLNYYLLRLTRLLRLGWITYGNGEQSSVWIGLSKHSLAQLALNIFKLVVSFPVLLAFLFACFSLKILRIDTLDYLFTIPDLLKEMSGININEIFSSLPALVALATIIPTIFFFYFYSQKREVRQIIDRKNSQYFEEVVILYEKLLIWIDEHIYELSKNFDYVIKCQDLIVEEFLKKEVPNYSDLAKEQHRISRGIYEGIDSFRFIEIDDLNELQEIINELSNDRLVKFTRLFSVKRFDIWYLYFRDFNLLRKETAEHSFYTKRGMSCKISTRSIYPCNFTAEDFEKKRKEESYLLSFSIYDDLKLLYRLMKARDSLRKYLYSSRTERMILKALKKDK